MFFRSHRAEYCLGILIDVRFNFDHSHSNSYSRSHSHRHRSSPAILSLSSVTPPF